jgi:N-acetyllactosaminide alpha-2,3-sialyltransferase
LLKREVSAFICVTPLQLFIARALIQERNIDNYVLLNMNPHDSNVLRRHFEKCAAGALESDYLTTHARIWTSLVRLKKVLRKWAKYRVTAIYLASIDHVFSQYIIHKVPEAQIFTFDDGAVNIIASSLYHAKPSLGVRRAIPYLLLRGMKDQDWIKKKIVRHFTIYPSASNIVDRDRLQALDLFGSKHRTVTDGSGSQVKIFLGFDHSPRYADAVEMINPDIYLAHPMEKRPERYKGYVSTDLIAEEYIASLCAQYEEIHVYSCKSSVLLNLKDERIRRFVVDLYGNASQLQHEYNKLATTLGCCVIDFTKIEQFSVLKV